MSRLNNLFAPYLPPRPGSSGARRSGTLDTALTGFFCAIMLVVFALADASLLFGTMLPGQLMVGVSMALVGCAVFAASIALRSQFRGCVGGVQESLVVILATMVAGLAEVPGLRIDPTGVAGAAERALLATSVVMIIGSTLVVGVCLWLVGRFRVGHFIRFVPYPVVAGFLAGTALLLIDFALALSIASAPGESPLQMLAAPQASAKIVLTVALAAVLTWLSRSGSSRAAVPTVLIGTIAAFVLITQLGEHIGAMTLDSWLTNDWMLAREDRSAPWPPIGLSDLALVRWDALPGQLPQLAVLVFIALMASLVTIGTLEVTLSTEVDHDRELQLLGSTNLLATLAGGMPGTHALAVTTLATRLHGNSRAVGVIVAALCIATLYFAGDLLTLLPRFVFGALLLWISVQLLKESLFDAWRRHGPLEFTAIASIAATIVLAGFLPGIVVGLLAGTALFVLGYSRIDVVRRHSTGSDLSSTVDRSAHDRRLLDMHGGEILFMALHGYLFFGSAHHVIERLKHRAGDASLPALRHVLIDFDRVSGIDSTARQILARLRLLADEHGLTVLVSAASDPVRSALLDGASLDESGPDTGVPTEADGGLHFHDTLDGALERAENALLERHGVDVLLEQYIELDAWLGTHASDTALLGLARYMQPIRLGPGQSLFVQGTRADGIYLVRAGRLDVHVGGEAERSVRVRQVGPGSVLGEVSVYLDCTASASVTAREPSELLFLSRTRLATMLAEAPELASLFHQRMATVLAARLVDNGRQIRLLSS